MEAFLVYIIVCVSSAGGCSDYAPSKLFIFPNKQECTEYAGGIYVRFLKRLKDRGIVVIDGKYFCLKFRESIEI